MSDKALSIFWMAGSTFIAIAGFISGEAYLLHVGIGMAAGFLFSRVTR